MLLNNRELASLIWLTVAAAWILSRRNLRSLTSDILKRLANPLLLVPLLVMLGWVALEIWVGGKLALWDIQPCLQHDRLDHGHRAGALFQR